VVWKWRTMQIDVQFEKLLLNASLLDTGVNPQVRVTSCLPEMGVQVAYLHSCFSVTIHATAA
jgi:hypothetical protein